MLRDFRHSGRVNHQIRNAETLRRRKKPANGGLHCGVIGKISGDRTGWLAQQCRWPPALPVFPANREFYREFFKITALGTPETANNGVAAGLLTQIPYATEQGIIFAEQGILAREQGILSPGTQILAG